MEQTIKKIFVNADRTVTLSCPHCGFFKNQPIDTIKNVSEPFSIRCKCGNVFQVRIELRNSFRKETKLEGKYAPLTRPDDWRRITVTNLSFEGCGFETLTGSLLQMEDEIWIEFTLDNSKKTLIKKKAFVRLLKGNYIGCKFKEAHGALDPDLGFYQDKPPNSLQ